MHILIVDDNEDKIAHIVEFLKSTYPEIRIDKSRSYNSGLKSIYANNYNLIILDMSLPVFDQSSDDPDNKINPIAGREILTLIQRKRLDVKTVILTQYKEFGEGINLVFFEELDKVFRTQYPDIYLGAIYFSLFESRWKFQLKEILSRGSIHGHD